MPRALAFATLLFVTSGAAGSGGAGSGGIAAQEVSVLHIKAVVVDPDGKATPVPRHALLISDEPPTTAPRRILTGLDGTANVRLRPGTYTVESDQPVVFFGKAYEWTQHIVIAAGREATLELTAGNAAIETAATVSASTGPLEVDPSFLQLQWQDSVVAIWTPTAHASGFLVDAKGLIVTNQRVIGTATSVEVQLSPDVKVAARVLEADAVRDVAVLWIDPSLVSALRPIPLGCAQPAKLPPDGQDLFAIEAPLRGPKRMTAGTVELNLRSGSEGGPVFGADGAVVGITSVVESRIIRTDAVCEAVASAEKKMKDAAPPAATHLPVDPSKPFPVEALKDALTRRTGSLNPYQMSTSDFDVAFLTPVHVYGDQFPPSPLRGFGAAGRSEPQPGRGRPAGPSTPAAPPVARPLLDFGNWSEYVADVPPVLLIRVTPKMVERFWTTVGRAAARTQGVDLPAFKHVKSGFARMRVFCGDAEVTPIHPFTVEQRVSEREAVDEGLYVFDPGALGPQCGSVKLVLYSEKEPAKGDTRAVDPRVVQQIWQDFAPYRDGTEFLPGSLQR